MNCLQGDFDLYTFQSQCAPACPCLHCVHVALLHAVMQLRAGRWGDCGRRGCHSSVGCWAHVVRRNFCWGRVLLNSPVGCWGGWWSHIARYNSPCGVLGSAGGRPRGPCAAQLPSGVLGPRGRGNFCRGQVLLNNPVGCWSGAAVHKWIGGTTLHDTTAQWGVGCRSIAQWGAGCRSIAKWMLGP